MMSRRYFLTLFVACATRLDAQVRHEFSELHMGVEVRMVVYAPDTARARSAARAAFVRVAELEEIMSDYRPKSELRRLEQQAGEWVPVSSDLFRVMARAVEVAEATAGAFDPTVGPLVALWREARRVQRLPNSAQLDSARALVGWRHIFLDTAGQRVRIARRGMHLDLGGIAKGYIVQQALLASGVASALVEAGGDIAVGAAPPGRSGWNVETPMADSVVRARASSLVNAVISTSGPSVQFLELGGKRYSHVIDPRTGIGLTSLTQSTVIASDGALADALSTALTVLSREEAMLLLARYPTVSASLSP